MEALVKEKEESEGVANGLDADIKALGERTTDFDKKITEHEKTISSIEGNLDDTVTATNGAHDKLEVATKTANDAELEVNALVRRIQLLEEETVKVNERLTEVMEKLPAVEKSLEENERTRKVLEAKSFQNEEKSELQDTQLVEATQIAAEADRKCEEVMRKLRMVEGDLERMVERAEDFEKNAADFDSHLEADRAKLKELEDLAGRNGTREDELEEQVRKLTFDMNTQDQRAEFAERTVDKLESNIDLLTDQLYQEKKDYRDMSVKLDATLNDMMGL